jgi:hypothetical protein
MKNNEICSKCEDRQTYHSVIDGHTRDRLSLEELEQYQFMVGGMLSK